MISIEYTTSNGYMILTTLELKGRGITKKDGDFYSVTEKAMEKLQGQYNVECNF